MPKKVDRTARRDEIVRTYLKIAARDGMEAATTRALAAELGVAVGSLWHYFSGFDEVLSSAFRMIFDRTNARIGHLVEGLDGLAALRAMLEEVLPIGSVPRDEAYVVVSFWGRVAANPSVGSLQVAVERQWRWQMSGFLREAVDAEELHPDAPVEDIADALLYLVTASQFERVLGTPLGQGVRLWQILRHHLAPWMTERAAQQWQPPSSGAGDSEEADASGAPEA
ncbi:TetR/AcrR family transcriptional regulator [Nesterenkonia xinjiangensis]|uniref:AcrR family transcriptional regulator n=1 Tax=Nesterenkonia xinjiangensis TaxID=225327 RepID=A0A7Z0GMN9_9MICC|nr:TetR family transcriptional regulator C-terminal domain-containing protein [Nesterenkonia xinjiangensis]NYJ78812.1 AcrR family transcriptional regulator [Nesterenkonia xinjiangensis]